MKQYHFIFFLFLFVGVSSRAQMLRLEVSPDHHHLMTSDGKPFFWLADTGWELFHKLAKQDAIVYFAKRAQQGFNVIQAVVLAELDGLHMPNANGDLPFRNDDVHQPNEGYFQYMDTLIAIAESYHLYIALLPTWGDKVFTDWWGKGPVIFNPTNAYVYGQWMGRRYKDNKNVIWIIGGDRDPRPGTQDVAVWRAMAKGVEDGVGGPGKALMTFHCQPKGTGSSSQWFQDDDWLDLNMLQTGHCRDTPVWETVSADYLRTPAKPVLNGECIYEEMPVCFNPKELGYASAYDVRKAAWLSVFAGACGHTYGCGPVIFFGEKESNIFAVLHGWKESLDLTGANEMKYLRGLIESRPMADLKPDQSILLGEGNCSSNRIQALRGKNVALVYSAYGETIIIRPFSISVKSLVATWYDPRSGQTSIIGQFDNDRALSFSPPLPTGSPVPSQKEDWVLIVESPVTK